MIETMAMLSTVAIREFDFHKCADGKRHVHTKELISTVHERRCLSRLFKQREDATLLDEYTSGSHPKQPTPSDETAGAMMLPAPPCLRRWMTVQEAIAFIKHSFHCEEDLHTLYVLDRYGCLLGMVTLSTLILAAPDRILEEIMDANVVTTHLETDQEEAAQLLADHDLLALPVLDDAKRLVGLISVDDVIDVLEEEATEDMYRLAQMSGESEIFSPILRAVRNRLPWLYVNMGTALLAASVVTFFEDTIARMALLAAFMPIVAAQGGNAGNQTMTIMVRSLALDEIALGDAWRALRRELLLGLLHGLFLGGSIGFIAWRWQGNPLLGVIIGIAMIANLSLSALVGVLVPLTLKRLQVDPALASGVFVTATTDVMGFAIFLGLATGLLNWLV
ncbi:magnesium transporter [Chloroflexi bacterium TSY]|nr:magnesium transporter [Chloroflexi bacterium TSY]